MCTEFPTCLASTAHYKTLCTMQVPSIESVFYLLRP